MSKAVVPLDTSKSQIGLIFAIFIYTLEQGSSKTLCDNGIVKVKAKRHNGLWNGVEKVELFSNAVGITVLKVMSPGFAAIGGFGQCGSLKTFQRLTAHAA